MDGGVPPADNGTGGLAGEPGFSDDGVTVAFIVPQGLAAVILTFSLFFAVASLVIVSLRIWIRARSNIIGWDDGLMVCGLVLFLVDTGLASYGTFQGLGTPNAEVGSQMEIIGLKYVMIWQLFYIVSLCFIKNSICITMLRIAINRTHRWALYGTIAVSTGVSLVGFIGMLTVCRPITAQWEAGSGTCAPRSVIIALNYVISAGAIVTDWACAIVPAFILWNAQMRRNVKLSVGIVLGLGSLASISTFLRIPYLKYYESSDNFLYNVGNIVLWSVFEGGIGLVAGSLPMLRQLFKRWLGSTARTTSVGPSNLVTIGGSHRKHSVSQSQKPPPYSSRASRTREDRGWDRLEDSNSDLHRLHDVPEHSESQYELRDLDRRDVRMLVQDTEKNIALAR
ncbi:hypothetical protein BKA67DRAFT_662639 [Truncatella angustata]|uniref:Rhodopsin domain-containing protein n=1 Tax=Truncatella angustata TaxID=152316 RepID=A0A9P8RQY9_9PEZI|nr:uncharacterized protein BKA67DRAFT_662639 [Truncatella angustata]KAH6647892.1 hypothetical protein BKA67DRAFT_662639 [Truncatella angustata]